MKKNDDILDIIEKVSNEIIPKSKTRAFKARHSQLDINPNPNNNKKIYDDEFVKLFPGRRIKRENSLKIKHPLQAKLSLLRRFSALNRTEFHKNNDNILLNQKKSQIFHEVREFRSKSATEQDHKKMKMISLMKKEIKKKIVLEKNVYFELEPNKNTRESMEDYINIEDMYNNEKKNKIFILCDGHSGHQAAEAVAKDLPRVFSKCLEKEKSNCESVNYVESAIFNSFIQMDTELKQIIDDESGCTTNLVYLSHENDKRFVYSGNVGDSRSIIVGSSEALRISYDHKATDSNEQKRVIEEKGVILKKRLYGLLAITRALGDFEMKEEAPCLSNKPHITKTEIKESDAYVVIASDGVWDVLDDKEVFKITHSTEFENLKGNDKDLAKLLVKKSVERRSKDNISCIAIKLN